MTSAVIAGARRLFVIVGVQFNVREAPQVIADSQKLRILADPREYFLSSWSQEFDPLLLHQFV